MNARLDTGVDILRVENLMDGLDEATTVREDGICTKDHTHANESTDDYNMNADTAMMINEQWIMSCHTYTCSPPTRSRANAAISRDPTPCYAKQSCTAPVARVSSVGVELQTNMY